MNRQRALHGVPDLQISEEVRGDTYKLLITNYKLSSLYIMIVMLPSL